MEILPVTNQFNVGFNSEKGEFTFYSLKWWEAAFYRPTGRLLLRGARTAVGHRASLGSAISAPIGTVAPEALCFQPKHRPAGAGAHRPSRLSRSADESAVRPAPPAGCVRFAFTTFSYNMT